MEPSEFRKCFGKKKGESRRFSFSQRSGTGCRQGRGQGCSCSGDWTARRVPEASSGRTGVTWSSGRPALASQGSSRNRNTVEREREGGGRGGEGYGVVVVVEVGRQARVDSSFVQILLVGDSGVGKSSILMGSHGGLF